MMTDRERERYLANSTNMQHLVRLTLAVRAQLPKKYRTQLHALFKHHPEVIETHQLTLTSRSCATSGSVRSTELPRLLHLMTRRQSRHDDLRDPGRTPGVGDTIQLTFTVPVDVQGGHSDARES